ncbi:RING/U-box superfamily protein [Raphanus sativus]|uniref:RING-type E3 ubiquitin transferase n=1 Tax=Raphanus sativus TaxID=3726 RepID=A0A9W3C831_RAPSA|nr:probable E3 ubiquitin-protein ligase RHG1A [Raphanus sativus]XP_056847718.1 probable E3 ubiquitin-protein ligase RHG1A [Raphanus sativus]XP_056847719.1 probable E3 ubiquitin-protein ligase RHG1A [Raphanus sativus]XP_056847720.1 probable E3 ubiquitin-protein ligase RHG1A [Raphanus sativus]XP_056847721.1 probable E3 ubiquitin-protein ligase RHG1A [Raphanus sativus]KAJ4881684.1 RING/U-box superfamily protein [Raphanus sativus]
MQGERASIGSLSETMNYEHGSTSSNPVVEQQIRWDSLHSLGDNDLHNYMSSSAAADANTSLSNSVYHEQRELQHRFTLGEASSSGPKNEAPSEQWMQMGRFEERRNDKIDLSPLLMQQPSSGNRVVRDVNLNAEYIERAEDMNPVTGHPGLSQVNENARAGCKRKAIDAGIGQSSSSTGAFHRGESSSSWVYNQNDLNISLNHPPRGLVSPSPPISSRSFSFGANPTAQQEGVFSAGSVIRQPVTPPSMNAPAYPPPVDHQYRHAFSNFTPLNPNASAVSMPPVSRNMTPPFQWSGNTAVAAGIGSSAPVDRNALRPGQSRLRSNMLANPLFVPAPPEPRNLHQGHGSGGAGHVSVQPSASTPTWTPYQNQSPVNQRRLSEHRRRSLISSLLTNQRAAAAAAARSMVPPPTPDQHVLQPGGDNNFQTHNQAYSRAVPRQGQTAVGVPHSLRSLVASTSRGRSRPSASEIRNVLDHMRRTGNLRVEDFMLLNQTMMLGAADVHDRYRDMRLDVDDMTYEELLSLEERIGDVCTGLNEETISNRLKQRKYNCGSKSTQEVEPCCVCQEEYKEGEEMGVLECGHDFHSQCIKEWLKRKNLCPICKTTGLNTAEKPSK